MIYLYDFFVRPIEYLIEVIFDILYGKLDNPGYAIIGVSLTVSLLTLPLYNRSESIQQEERDKQKAMSRWVDHIKKTFRSDERYMMLSAYYRQMHYHPIYALRSMFSLLLQIPFFIAAYHFLSHLEILSGTGFWFIQNLGMPDAAVRVGGSAVNVLPVAMTCINLLSTVIYLKDAARKELIQPVLTALVFLVLLYRSPSGLVLYWTCNNLFSLLKNVFLRMLGGFFQKKATIRPQGISRTNERIYGEIAVAAAIAVFFLMLLIPATVIASDPAVFTEAASLKSPVRYIVRIACIVGGSLFLWGGVVFYLSGERGRRMESFILLCCATGAAADYILVNDDESFGLLDSLLFYGREPVYAGSDHVRNTIMLVVIFLICGFLFLRFRKMCRAIGIILCVTLMSLCVLRLGTIHTAVRVIMPRARVVGESSIKKTLPLKKQGKNVIVLMMDRAISGFLPYILEERPELRESFSGFVYYPNTISYAGFTNAASPALYGGYEYTPSAMNKRPEMLLMEKHNEALRVMPVLFSEEGYDVTVTDPPYGNYEMYSDLSIYDEYAGIRALRLSGTIKDDVFASDEFDEIRVHNFLFYTLFRMAPTPLKNDIYDQGTYRRVPDVTEKTYNLGEIKSDYPVLKHLPDLTDIGDVGNSFLMMTNVTTHVAPHHKLQLPDYEPQLIIDNSGYDLTRRVDAEGNVLDLALPVGAPHGGRDIHYSANAAAWIQVGKWLDWMKEQGVYDNSRIIIVSDHGSQMELFPEVEKLDICWLNAFLFVKDFNAAGEPVTNDRFMTNADVPTLALDGIVQNPRNPFTGEVISDREKYMHPQEVLMGVWWEPDKKASTWGTDKTRWYSVEDNIFVDEYWRVLENAD